MTIWEQYNLEERILNILNVRYSHDPEHHFGRPFLTPYQIAISFREQYFGLLQLIILTFQCLEG